MSNTDKLREFAYTLIERVWETGNGDSHECNTRFDDLRNLQNCIDNNLDDAIEKLTALISEHYYPKEFLLWTGENCQYYPDTNEWMYFESPMTQQYFKGTDELFNYWKENEQ